MGLIKDELTEQQRVRIVAGLWAISRTVWQEQAMEIIEKSAEFNCQSEDLANLVGLPIEVVNAALENLSDEEVVEIVDREDRE